MLIRVFVLDDDDTIRVTLTKFLEKRGYEVFAFPRPALCRRCRCPEGQTCTDIIISDVKMPGLTGLEFIENRRMKGCKATSVALMSGNWSESDLQKARKQGCHVFHKPLDATEINTWLDDCEKKIDPDRTIASLFLETRSESIVS